MNNPIRVLIVEDSENDAALLLRELRRSDFDIVHARVEDAPALHAALREGNWDIVFSDHVMPQFDSFMALEIVRKEHADIPFIVISGVVGEDVAVEVMRAGAADYLLKDNLIRLVPAMTRELEEAESRRQRRWAEGALLDSEALKAAIVQTAHCGIVAIDRESCVVEFNPGAEEIFGYTEVEMKDRKDFDLIFTPKFHDMFQNGIREFIRNGKSQFFGKLTELTVTQNAGEKVTIDVIVSAIQSNDRYIFTAIVRDITERKQAEEKIRNALVEKEVMLREIHHRVKNNLQSISSMLSLQASTDTMGSTVEELKKSQRRIMVMARIHEALHQTDDLAFISARDLLTTVVEDTMAGDEDNEKRVSLNLDVDNIILDMDVAIPCAQIVSELLSNCLKHAFPNGKSGNIEVSLHRWDGNRMELSVADDGKGFTKKFDLENKRTLGMRLVRALAIQLNGLVDIGGADGAHIKITFPEKPS